jgi:HlyD family secretion protein
MPRPEIKLAATTGAGMDRKIQHTRWSLPHWPAAAKLALGCAALVLTAFVAIKLTAGAGVRTIRLPAEQVTLAKVEQGIFHDLIPLRANVVPRETVYVDAIDGGRVDRVLVEAGDLVQQGQPIIELSNTNLALSVIQQESQLNQAISQLQQNEISLEQNKLANERALAEVEYGLVRLKRSDARRSGLLARGAESVEQRDVIADELTYYERLKPIQARAAASRYTPAAREPAQQPGCRSRHARRSDHPRPCHRSRHSHRSQSRRAPGRGPAPCRSDAANRYETLRGYRRVLPGAGTHGPKRQRRTQ